MLHQTLLYLGALLPALWGTAHLIFTLPVLKGFGDISIDNRRILTMEWIVEGVSLLFIGVVVAAVTYMDRTNTVSQAIYWLSFSMLNVLSVISLFTGFKVAFITFKLCPIIFTGSSILILIGMHLIK